MSALRNELDTDPNGLGYAPLIAEGATGKIVEILNEPIYDKVFKIAIEDYVGYLIDNGKFAPMILAASNGDALAAGLVGQLRIAKELGIKNIDMSSSVIQGQHEMLIQAEYITQSDLDNINALATVKISRADQIGLGNVAVTQVIAALEESI